MVKKKSEVQMTIQRYADNPPATLPKTDHQRIKELKELMIRSGGKDVAEKVIQIARNDEHPGQDVAYVHVRKGQGPKVSGDHQHHGIGGNADNP